MFAILCVFVSFFLSEIVGSKMTKGLMWTGTLNLLTGSWGISLGTVKASYRILLFQSWEAGALALLFTIFIFVNINQLYFWLLI